MNYKIAFFGTDSFSTNVLEELKLGGFLPTLIITAPDRKSGRGQHVHSPLVKTWSDKNGIASLQPEKLNDDFVNKLKEEEWDLFIVASYGKIVPQKVLDVPKHQTLNVHPSLLPLFRGASPIESAILSDQKETGVTIMRMDKDMDHGPIVKQEKISFIEWPNRTEIEENFAKLGGKMLCTIIPEWINGNIKESEQNHNEATYTKKIEKENGLIKIEDLEKREAFLKIKALNPWPGAYFFHKHLDKEIRVKITDADFREGKTIITKVIPEGRKEMSFESFRLGFHFNQDSKAN